MVRKFKVESSKFLIRSYHNKINNFVFVIFILNKETIIQKTLNALKILPQEKAEEISDFADFLLKKHEEQILQNGIEILQSESEAFTFLNEEEELYLASDVKEKD